MATTWFTIPPPDDEELRVLAEVDRLAGDTGFIDLTWKDGTWCMGLSGIQFKGAVLRWTPLAPIADAPMDKRKPDVTALVELFTKLNDGDIDQPGMARNHCSTLLRQFEKIYGPKYPDRSPFDMVADFMKAAKANPFHGPKATYVGYLVKFRKNIINSIRESNGNPQRQSPYDKLAEGLADIHRED